MKYVRFFLELLKNVSNDFNHLWNINFYPQMTIFDALQINFDDALKKIIVWVSVGQYFFCYSCDDAYDFSN